MMMNSLNEKREMLRGVAKKISIVSAMTAAVSLFVAIYYFIRTTKCMNELDGALPVMGKAAEKYLQENEASEHTEACEDILN